MIVDYVLSIVDSSFTIIVYELTVYYNKLICIRIRIYFLKMKYFVLNTSSHNITKLRKIVTSGFCCC